MKVKVSNFLAPLTVFILLNLTVKAQDELPVLENQDPFHREFNLDEDKILIYEHNHAPSVKDSTQQTPRVTPGHSAKISKPDAHKGGHKDKEEEDALSFNFLYYMFQKFKMSDLVDN